MKTYIAGLVGLLGVIVLIAGVQSHGPALFAALTGQGIRPLNPGADPLRGPAGAAPPVDTGPPVGTGQDPNAGQIPGLPPIPGMPYPRRPAIPGVTQ